MVSPCCISYLVAGILYRYVACTPTTCQVPKPAASYALSLSRGSDYSGSGDSSDEGVSLRRRRSNSPDSRGSQLFVEDRYHNITYVRVWACVERLPRCVVVGVIEDHRHRTKGRMTAPFGVGLTAMRSNRCLYHNNRHPGKCRKQPRWPHDVERGLRKEVVSSHVVYSHSLFCIPPI